MNDTILVHASLGTYIARWRGKTTTTTRGPLAAAYAVARKVLRHHYFSISGGPRGGDRYVYYCEQQ